MDDDDVEALARALAPPAAPAAPQVTAEFRRAFDTAAACLARRPPDDDVAYKVWVSTGVTLASHEAHHGKNAAIMPFATLNARGDSLGRDNYYRPSKDLSPLSPYMDVRDDAPQPELKRGAQAMAGAYAARRVWRLLAAGAYGRGSPQRNQEYQGFLHFSAKQARMWPHLVAALCRLHVAAEHPDLPDDERLALRDAALRALLEHLRGTALLAELLAAGRDAAPTRAETVLDSLLTLSHLLALSAQMFTVWADVCTAWSFGPSVAAARSTATALLLHLPPLVPILQISLAPPLPRLPSLSSRLDRDALRDAVLFAAAAYLYLYHTYSAVLHAAQGTPGTPGEQAAVALVKAQVDSWLFANALLLGVHYWRMRADAPRRGQAETLVAAVKQRVGIAGLIAFYGGLAYERSLDSAWRARLRPQAPDDVLRLFQGYCARGFQGDARTESWLLRDAQFFMGFGADQGNLNRFFTQHVCAELLVTVLQRGTCAALWPAWFHALLSATPHHLAVSCAHEAADAFRLGMLRELELQKEGMGAVDYANATAILARREVWAFAFSAALFTPEGPQLAAIPVWAASDAEYAVVGIVVGGLLAALRQFLLHASNADLTTLCQNVERGLVGCEALRRAFLEQPDLRDALVRDVAPVPLPVMLRDLVPPTWQPWTTSGEAALHPALAERMLVRLPYLDALYAAPTVAAGQAALPSLDDAARPLAHALTLRVLGDDAVAHGAWRLLAQRAAEDGGMTDAARLALATLEPSNNPAAHARLVTAAAQVAAACPGPLSAVDALLRGLHAYAPRAEATGNAGQFLDDALRRLGKAQAPPTPDTAAAEATPEPTLFTPGQVDAVRAAAALYLLRPSGQGRDVLRACDALLDKHLQRLHADRPATSAAWLPEALRQHHVAGAPAALLRATAGLASLAPHLAALRYIADAAPLGPLLWKPVLLGARRVRRHNIKRYIAEPLLWTPSALTARLGAANLAEAQIRVVNTLRGWQRVLPGDVLGMHAADQQPAAAPLHPLMDYARFLEARPGEAAALLEANPDLMAAALLRVVALHVGKAEVDKALCAKLAGLLGQGRHDVLLQQVYDLLHLYATSPTAPVHAAYRRVLKAMKLTGPP